MAARSVPKDVLINQAILKDMGVINYEPRLVNQMLEFTYRYVSDILEDAKIYSQHANKKNIDTDDIKLAVQCKLDNSFTNPPPRDLLLDVARHKNSTPLPLIKPFTGPRLPPDRYCLTTPNFRLKSYKKALKTLGVTGQPKFSITQANTGRPLMSSVGGGGGATGGPALTLVTKSTTIPTFAIKSVTSPSPAPRTMSIPIPIVRFTPVGTATSVPSAGSGQTSASSTDVSATVTSLKRKREEDDMTFDDL